MKRIAFAAVLALGLGTAACAGSYNRTTHDPWLRSKSASDCPQPSCLFAILVDSAGTPLAGADVELTGTTVHVTTNNQGRIMIQAIPLGSHRIRVFANGEPIESTPVAFGYTFNALVLELRGEQLRVRS